MCLKYEKIGHMANKKKVLEINNTKIKNKIFKVTPAHLKCLYILQSMSKRKSNFNYKSLSTFN